MRKENKDIVGEKCIRDDSGKLAYSDDEKIKAWKQHYERLLNIELPWSEDDLSVADPVLGRPPLVTREMAEKSISKMKLGKVPGPSGVVTEVLKASSDVCCEMIADLTNSIIRDNTMPSEWNDSIIISLYKGKGEALDRGNYRGLKLIQHILDVMERIFEDFIRNIVNIDDMQFGFMHGRGTKDAIFIVRQIQEVYIRKNRNLFFAFVDLEKAFDRVPRKVLWWTLRKVGIPEWIARVIQVMYQNARSQVRVNNLFSDVFDVQVGVHQGSVLSPLLFIIVLEALSREFRTSCSWELLYDDDLVLIADAMDELLSKLGNWKKHLEAKGLRVNMGKTKIMISGKNLHSLRDSGKHPCGVCRKGVGSTSILCCGCQLWIHKKCSGIKGKLTAENHVTLEGSKLNVVESFGYLGDELCPGGGCELATIARSRVALGKFRDLLLLLSSSTISLARRGMLFNSCVRGVSLHASVCWALRKEDIQRLLRNERAMLRCMLRVKAEDDVSLHDRPKWKNALKTAMKSPTRGNRGKVAQSR